MRKSYIQIGGVLYEKGSEPREPAGPMVMPDIQPYTSMIDGSTITSRSKHREHLRAHGYQEVGNDPSLLAPRPPALPDVNPAGRKELIRSQIAAMTHAEFKRAVQRTVDNWKWNSRKD